MFSLTFGNTRIKSKTLNCLNELIKNVVRKLRDKQLTMTHSLLIEENYSKQKGR